MERTDYDISEALERAEKRDKAKPDRRTAIETFALQDLLPYAAITAVSTLLTVVCLVVGMIMLGSIMVSTGS